MKIEEFSQKHIREKYASLWNDFVSIRINLFNGKLQQLFAKKSNVNKSKLNEFYKYFSYCRTLCVRLPVNADDCSAPKLYGGFGRNPWLAMIENLNDDDDYYGKGVDKCDIADLDHIYRFSLLWNGIFVMMNKNDANFNCGLLTRIQKLQLSRCGN